ncbi:hypothetical protein GR11A_00137 [Vibrio phage vB_VcorM_GR11A]|nr:hypothetical protein GR11A_00137 [Vibrio phage vB_VcorM_GR11A]
MTESIVIDGEELFPIIIEVDTGIKARALLTHDDLKAAVNRHKEVVDDPNIPDITKKAIDEVYSDA